MYEAKRAGKGQIRIFDPAMRLVATKHLEYRSDLGEALERGQLRLVYMPFVDLRTGQVTGAEALIRWQHPEHGDIPASEFVPIAERSGLIVPMGYWVLERGLAQIADVAARAVRRLQRVGRADPPARLRRAGCRARRPTTTSIRGRSCSSSPRPCSSTRAIGPIETVSRLREEGFRFAIDDFGAGYCSLSYLQRHPVDLLKIDRTAIEEFGSDPRGNTLARTILQMADSLDLLTVAEGIETTGQLRELRRFGCDLGQGYLLSRPLEEEALARRFGHTSAAPPASPDRSAYPTMPRGYGGGVSLRIGMVCPYSLSIPGESRPRCSGWPASCGGLGTRCGCSAPCDGPPPEPFVTPARRQPPDRRQRVDRAARARSGRRAAHAPRAARRGLRRDPRPRAAGARVRRSRPSRCTYAPTVGTFHAAGRSTELPAAGADAAVGCSNASTSAVVVSKDALGARAAPPRR